MLVSEEQIAFIQNTVPSELQGRMRTRLAFDEISNFFVKTEIIFDHNFHQ